MTFDRVPLDPTTPRDPVVIARRRPDSVTFAGAAMYGAAVLGLLSSIAQIAAVAAVVAAFRSRAPGWGVDDADARAAATVIRTVLLSSGLGALVLAVLTGILGRGVLRRNEAARIGALVLVAGSLGCGLVRTSVTAFGRNIDWTVGTDTPASLTGNVAQAYSEALPGWLVGLAGGLTDLQALGYIAVAILLLAPASQEYFRTRVSPAVNPAPTESPPEQE